MTSNRREFLIRSGAALAIGQVAAPAVATGNDRTLEGLLADIAEELLVDYPESASMLGIDTGTRAPLKSKLADRSPPGQEEIRKRSAHRLELLTAPNSSRSRTNSRSKDSVFPMATSRCSTRTGRTATRLT